MPLFNFRIHRSELFDKNETATWSKRYESMSNYGMFETMEILFDKIMKNSLSISLQDRTNYNRLSKDQKKEVFYGCMGIETINDYVEIS